MFALAGSSYRAMHGALDYSGLNNYLYYFGGNMPQNLLLINIKVLRYMHTAAPQALQLRSCTVRGLRVEGFRGAWFGGEGLRG